LYRISGPVVEQWKSDVKGTSISVAAMQMLMIISLQGVNMPRYNAYQAHYVRSHNNFKPLTWLQFNALCDKIESQC
jgi:hypothetical protein